MGGPLTQLVTDVSRAYPHELKTVYVSVDTHEQHYKDATVNRPWLAMAWADGSSEPEEGQTDDVAPPSPTESFLLAGDDDLDESVVAADATGSSYVRPFSRVYMADKLDVLMTPTLAVYHLPTRKFLDTNVRQSRLRPMRLQNTMDIWLRGEPSPSINLVDAMYTVPWTVAMIVAALIYLVVRLVVGEQASLPSLVARFTETGATYGSRR